MEKIDGNYDVLWNVNDNVFALKGYSVNGYVRAFIVMCHDGIPLPYIYDVNNGVYISICKDKYGLIDDRFMEAALKRETDVVGFSMCEYDSLRHIGRDSISVHDFLNELQLPAAEIIEKFADFRKIETRVL